jgi:AcrR family transcriptional regulator
MHFSNFFTNYSIFLKREITFIGLNQRGDMKDNQRRELILRAGSECFARFGYDKTTLDDIGRRAGLNKASLYYYFKNKEEILQAVAAGATQRFVADLQTRALAFPDVRKQLRFFLTERIRRCGEMAYVTAIPAENLHSESRAAELAFLTDLLRKASAENVVAVRETSAALAERLLLLSDVFKQEALRSSGQFGGGAVDAEPAVAQVEYWLGTILR